MPTYARPAEIPFVTTQQESLYQVLQQKEEAHGPRPDWISARASVEALAALQPSIAGPDNGAPMRGTELAGGLAELVARFDEMAVPVGGKYVPDDPI